MVTYATGTAGAWSLDMTTGTTSAVISYPDHVLGPVLQTIRYKAGWSFGIDSGGLKVGLETVDSDDDNSRWFVHTFPIPPLWTPEEAEDFVFACILKVESHEAAEFFRVNEQRPFLPHHFDGHDPYRIERR